MKIKKQDYVAPKLPGHDIVKVGLDMKGWQQAAEVLDRVTSVPTIFFDFNRRSTVGGLPVRRVHTISGPTHHGKSAAVLGFLHSFLMGNHIAAYVDAEHATGLEFVEHLFAELSTNPNFYAKRPDNYEQTMDSVDDLIQSIARARVGRKPSGKVGSPDYDPGVPPQLGLCSVLAVDSINKLVPARELAAIKKAGIEEIAKGHFGRMRAAMNQAWLDHLVPLLHTANMALILIAQEREEADGSGGGWAARQSEDLKVHVKGGNAIQFDASMLMRVTKVGAVYDNDKASSKDEAERKEARKDAPIVGFKHRIRIRKSKVGILEGSYTDAHFHMSNGKGMAPAGFDMVRDAVMVGMDMGIFKRSDGGSWVSFRRHKFNGQRKLLERLYQDEQMKRELFADVIGATEREGKRPIPGLVGGVVPLLQP